MKKILLIPMLFLSVILNAQIDKSSADYKKGVRILEQTQQEIDLKNGDINYAHYWNLAAGIALTEGNKIKTYNYLLQCQKKDNVGFNDLVGYLIEFNNNDILTTKFHQLLKDEFLNLIAVSEREISKNSDQKEIEITNIINEKAVRVLIQMMLRDQKHRQTAGFLWNKSLQTEQRKLDLINREELIKLYDNYGYPGKSITGDNKYKNYTCLITEHGQDLKDQKKWLPIISQAHKEGELNTNPLKMLLDRIHWQEYNKQYFGSHVGVPFTSGQEIVLIKSKYGIE
jgi:hypothetical protein